MWIWRWLQSTAGKVSRDFSWALAMPPLPALVPSPVSSSNSVLGMDKWTQVFPKKRESILLRQLHLDERVASLPPNRLTRVWAASCPPLSSNQPLTPCLPTNPQNTQIQITPCRHEASHKGKGHDCTWSCTQRNVIGDRAPTNCSPQMRSKLHINERGALSEAVPTSDRSTWRQTCTDQLIGPTEPHPSISNIPFGGWTWAGHCLCRASHSPAISVPTWLPAEPSRSPFQSFSAPSSTWSLKSSTQTFRSTSVHPLSGLHPPDRTFLASPGPWRASEPSAALKT